MSPDDAGEAGKETADALNAAADLPGDCNGDKAFDNKDVALLFRSVCGEVIDEVIEKTLDFNSDGKVNNKDVTQLFRMVSAD